MESLPRVAAAAVLAAAWASAAAQGAARGGGAGRRARPLEKVTLVGALYGDGTDWRDVKAEAVARARLLEDGVVALDVDPEAFGGEGAAPGRALVLTFEFRGRRLTMLSGDGQRFVMDAASLLAAHADAVARSRMNPSLPVTVAGAWYGAGSTWVDVTQAVLEKARYDAGAGVLSCEASNGLFGDPAVGMVKRLVVICVVDGREVVASAREGATLRAPVRGADAP